ncbi:MAG: hypothetical protein JXO51_03740 [Candidatus Aminicenantes bacterium]|nr:hypothetical protein [Candidatus Aminicenantes bacterium]
MNRKRENPLYVKRRRHGAWPGLVLLFLAVSAVSALWLLHREPPAGETPPALSENPAPDEKLPAEFPEKTEGQSERVPDAAFWPSPPADAGMSLEAERARQPETAVPGDDFAVLKALTLDLYRRNELAAALERVRAALALQGDGKLLELQARLEREIEVQRNYDGARAARFTVLFDGYEHEAIKHAVLGILKDAYSDIGKELNFFPEQPVTVILYTAKDFSDVTRAPAWVGGMFGQLDGKIRVPVQGAEGRAGELRRVLYHEYTHAALFAMAPGCPLWLHEGLAQHFSGDEVVNVNQAIPLGMLANGFPREPRLAYLAYMESLQAIQDLVEEFGMARLRRLLAGLRGGRDLESAFASAYGESFSRWAAAWRPVPGRE